MSIAITTDGPHKLMLVIPREIQLYGMAITAEHFVKKAGSVEPSKLHNLMGLAQGWSLAYTGRPLFDSPILAIETGYAIATLLPFTEGRDDDDLIQPHEILDQVIDTLTYRSTARQRVRYSRYSRARKKI